MRMNWEDRIDRMIDEGVSHWYQGGEPIDNAAWQAYSPEKLVGYLLDSEVHMKEMLQSMILES